MARAATNRGFTLIEVVVALAIFGVLVTVLYASLASVDRAYGAAEAAVEDGSRERIGTGFLSTLVERAYPLALPDGREWIMRFEGDAESVSFVADMPGHVGVSGLHEVVLSVREEDERSSLWFSWRPMMVDEDGEVVDEEFDTRVLIPDVASMQLRYYGATEEEDDPQWADAWSGHPRLPALVEISLEDAKRVRWPVLRARPRATTPRYLSVRRGGAGGAGGGDAGNVNPDPSVVGSGQGQPLTPALPQQLDQLQRGLVEGAAGNTQ